MPVSSNATRYAARVDAHLQTLATEALRRDFLAREEAKWIRRYEQFQRKVDSNLPITDEDGTAWDYVETLAEITGRLAPLREPAHA
jgi:hypothetical protein